MLISLFIKNYAIIEEVTIAFSEGFNIITGETGAGKSILLGALNLILGERADTSVLVNKEQKSVIEGTFNVAGKEVVNGLLQQMDIDLADELLVRREIAVNGKTRAFVNDTPVTLSQLQLLSAYLVDLHQQFDTADLNNQDFQVKIVDALAGNDALLQQYQAVYKNYQQQKKQLAVLQDQKSQFQKESDYNQFLFDELREAALQPDELEHIDEQLKTLANAEGIKAALTQSSYVLQDADEPIVSQIKTLIQQLNHYSKYNTTLEQLAQRLQSTHIELQDIADELSQLSDHISYDAAEIERLNERLSLGYRLQKKHGVNSTGELINIYQDLETKLQSFLNIDEDIQNLEIQVQQALTEATALAGKLSANRKKQAAPFEKNVNQLLHQVGMPNAAIQLSIAATALNNDGVDDVHILFDANKSGQFKPVGKVASGGELSRLMLCIKSLVAERMDMPTLIFDEIDTGISGEAAKQVGIIMKQLTQNRQVICITHQPQIAGKADTHYFVYKEQVEGKVKTNIRTLGKEERVEAIAKMLSGEKPTLAAIENAREMIDS